MRKIKAIAITGPTASGKTALSLALAKRICGEIISLDSMQIYRGMDIGTAKATPAEREAVRHHMLDIIEPTESFSAQEYKRLATECAADIDRRGVTPIFVGGTGLYLDTLMREQSDAVPESSEEYRRSLPYDPDTDEGKDALYQRLLEVDEKSALSIHKNNVRRVIRALEIYDKTGKPKSYFDELSRKVGGAFDMTHITLDFHSREALYERINTRVDQMLDAGLVSEVRELYESGRLIPGTTAAAAIGYKEILLAVQGKSPLNECTEALKLATRNYAKRQLTWFRHNEDAIRVLADSADGRLRGTDELLSEVLDIIGAN